MTGRKAASTDDLLLYILVLVNATKQQAKGCIVKQSAAASAIAGAKTSDADQPFRSSLLRRGDKDAVASENKRTGRKISSGPIETPIDWITTSTPARARWTTIGSKAFPSIFRNLGWSNGMRPAVRASARTVWPAAKACFTVSSPRPPLAPMMRIVAMSVVRAPSAAWVCPLPDIRPTTTRRGPIALKIAEPEGKPMNRK